MQYAPTVAAHCVAGIEDHVDCRGTACRARTEAVHCVVGVQDHRARSAMTVVRAFKPSLYDVE
jgi:hypothetical protein